MKIAIVGAGIAGTTAAFWLHRSGFDVTVFEAAPELRDGGYIVDFWGVGYEVAEKMGLTAQVHAAGYDVEQLRLVDQNGGRVGGFNTRALRRMADGRFTSVARGDLARMIFNSVEGQVSTRFGSRVVDIEQSEVGVKVRPRSGRPQSFDLVIGADGTHSAVRRAVFGPDDRFETDLGYQVAAFEVPGYRPRDELVYLAHSSPGRMISRFAMRGDRTMFLTVFTDDRLPGPAPPHDRRHQTRPVACPRNSWVGMSPNSRGTGANRGHLFRPHEPDHHGPVVQRTGRVDRRRRQRGIAAGRGRHRLGDGAGVRACR